MLVQHSIVSLILCYILTMFQTASEAIRTVPLDSFEAVPVVTQACIAEPIAAAEVMLRTEYDGMTVAVVQSGHAVYAAIEADGAYTAFHALWSYDWEYPYRYNVTLEPFEALEHAGLRLTYPVGARGVSDCYFTFSDGVPSLLLECSMAAKPVGELLVSEFGSMVAQVDLYRAVGGGIVCYDLNRELAAISPEASDIWIR